MTDNTLVTATQGDTAQASDVNQIIAALDDTQVPRTGNGIPTDEAGGLGLSTKRFGKSYIKDVTRNLVEVSTGTVDISDTNILKISGTSFTINASSATWRQLNSFTFTLDTAGFVNLFFSCESTTLSAYNRHVTIAMVPNTSSIVGQSGSDTLNNSDAGVVNARTKYPKYLENVLYCATGTGYPEYNSGPIRESKDLFFEAGTHTVYLVYMLDNFTGSSANNITYNNYAYGARRSV